MNIPRIIGTALRWLLRQGRELSLLLFLLALWGYLGLVKPEFLQGPNLEDLLVNSAYTAIAAVGMTLVIIAGGIDISIGSMLAVCSVLAGTAAKVGWPLPEVVLATVAAGLILGTVNGFLTGYARVPSIIVTLGTLSIYRGLMTWITRGYWIHGLPPSFTRLGMGRWAGLPVPVWVMALVVLVFGLLLSRTSWGRWVYAVGGNPRAARLAGLNVTGVTVVVFALCGALTGVATLTFATRFEVIQSNAGLGFELLVITAVVVGGTNIFGGRGSIWGSFLGVLLLSTIGSALTFLHISVYWEKTVQGGLILLAIVADLLRWQRQRGVSLERIGEVGKGTSASARVWPRWMEVLRKREVPLLGLLGLSALVMSLLSDKFLTLQNLLEMTRHFVEIGLLALPMTLIIITAGIDLSVGSVMGICAVILGFAWDRAHFTLGSAVAATLLVGALAGLGNGALIAWMRIPALIVTLATMAIYRGLADGISQAHRVSNFPPAFFFLGQGHVGPFPTQLVLFAVLAALTALALSRTTCGRSLYALGSNEETARLSGLPVSRLKFLVYTLSGLLAGLAALVYVSRVSTAKPDAGLGLELDVITAVVLGGTSIAGGEGSILGSVLGLSILSVLRRGLTLANFPTEGQAVLLGALLIGAVWLDRLVRRD